MASTHTVIEGDYGIKIAQQYVGDGSRWVELKPLNTFVTERADPKKTGFPIFVGDVITLPSDWGQTPSPDPVPGAAMPLAYWAATEDNFDGYSGEASEWSALWLGGECLPGEWQVDVILNPDIEKKKAKGQRGAAINDQGDHPTQVRMRGQLHMRSHWEDWQRLVPVLFAKKSNVERKPLAIDHPQTACYGISVVYWEKLEAQQPDQDIMVVAIDAIEWTPQPSEAKTSAIPKQSEQASADEALAQVWEAYQQSIPPGTRTTFERAPVSAPTRVR
jgi:hypothetical protein